MREFKQYTRFPEDCVAEEAVKAIGHGVRTQADVSAKGLGVLMRLLKSTRCKPAYLAGPTPSAY